MNKIFLDTAIYSLYAFVLKEKNELCLEQEVNFIKKEAELDKEYIK